MNNCYAIPIAIEWTQDLNFGTLVQGDSAKRVRPAKGEPNNARFDVTGDKNTAYTIILPVSFDITRNGSGSFPLQVKNLKSKPAEGANGLLNKKGKQTLYIGARLQKIPQNQAGGNYSGTFTVDVIY